MARKISEAIKKFVTRNPSVKECLQRDLVNLSSLAQAALNSNDQKTINSGIVAGRRLQRKLKPSSHEKKPFQLLKKAKIKVVSRITVVTIRKLLGFDAIFTLQKTIKERGGDFYLIEGQNHITIITNDIHASSIKNALSKLIIQITKDLSLLALTYPPAIKTTPGVVSFVYALLAANHINIREELSCWTDIMIVIEKAMVEKALELLEVEPEDYSED